VQLLVAKEQCEGVTCDKIEFDLLIAIPLPWMPRTAAADLSNDRDPDHRPTRPEALSFPHHNAWGTVMAERLRNRTSTAAARQRRRLFRGPGPWLDTTEVLAALARAWTVTTIATALFLVALAMTPVWDGAIFMHALRDALSGDPQLTQPLDEAPADSPVDRESLRARPGGWPVRAEHGVSPARPQ
jgi:hypothetical protein